MFPMVALVPWSRWTPVPPPGGTAGGTPLREAPIAASTQQFPYLNIKYYSVICDIFIEISFIPKAVCKVTSLRDTNTLSSNDSRTEGNEPLPYITAVTGGVVNSVA